jgi:hypothetical protein
MTYRIVLEGRDETTTLEFMHEKEDAYDWAEAVTVGYALVGLPNGEPVVKTTKQANGDWRLQTDGGAPLWVRVQEVIE